jgi:hypothetical protein
VGCGLHWTLQCMAKCRGRARRYLTVHVVLSYSQDACRLRATGGRQRKSSRKRLCQHSFVSPHLSCRTASHRNMPYDDAKRQILRIATGPDSLLQPSPAHRAVLFGAASAQHALLLHSRRSSRNETGVRIEPLVVRFLHPVRCSVWVH